MIHSTFDDNVFDMISRTEGTLEGGFESALKRMVSEESGRLMVPAKRWTPGNVSLE